MKNIYFSLMLFVFLGKAAFADVPILKENLLSEESQIKTKMSLGYTTSQPTPNQYVDVASTTLIARYGLTKTLELNSSVTGLSQSTRNSLGQYSTKSQENRFGSFTAGLSYQFDTRIIRSFAFLNVTLLEAVSYPDYRQKGFAIPPDLVKKVSGKQASVGGMLMAVEEPLIYGLSFTANGSLPYQAGDNVTKRGSGFGVSGNVNLLVNQENSLEWGIRYNVTQPTTINRHKMGVTATTSAWLLAALFVIDDDWYGNLSATSSITGPKRLTLSTGITLKY